MFHSHPHTSLLSHNSISQAIKEVIGTYEDIPAPDMNTDARVMAWFFDEYSKYKGFNPGVVTGKVGGSRVCTCCASFLGGCLVWA